MRVTFRPSREQVKAERQKKYLEAWPIEKQLEAHAEAMAGRPEKLNSMLEDFARIREVLSFCEEEEDKK